MTSNLVLFTFRNVKVFFRDRVAAVTSMFGAIIIIALYFLFLGDMLASSYPEVPGARVVIDSWAMAGVLAVVPVTTTLGALGLMVQDKVSNAVRDFTVSPMRTYEIVGGYVLSTFIVGMIMSFLALAFAEVYILSNGGSLLNASELVRVVGIILLSVVSASAVMFFVVLFVNSSNAFSAVSSIIGTMIGFLIGAFIPVGFLPSGAAAVVKMVPASHSAALFRQTMMERPMESMAGMTADELLQFELDMGVKFEWGGGAIGPELSVIILAAAGTVFFVLAMMKLSMKRK
jgi:multidrug/hemolysin transport system permease protein